MSVTVRPHRKRGKTNGWEVDIRIIADDGTEVMRERKKAPVSTKSAAKRWGEARERELLFCNPAKPRKEVPTLAEFQSRYIKGYAKANRQKPSGIKAKETIYKKHLVPLLGDKRLDKIGTEDVQRLKSSLEGKNTKTVNNVLSVLNTTLKAAKEWDVIESMPCTIKLLKVSVPDMEFYDFDEYEDLVEAAGKIGQSELLTVLVGGDAGLRLGEIIALEQTDIDYRRRYLTVRQAEWQGEVDTPKGNRIRRVPMTKRLAKVLQEYRHLRGPRVFYRADGSTITRHVLRNWLKKAERRAGLKPVGGLHILRHTFCSHLAMRGAPARAIQELAGHKDITTTQRYMHLSPAAVESAIRLLDDRKNGARFGANMEPPESEIPNDAESLGISGGADGT